MARRKRPLFETPPGFRPRIGPHDIPPDLIVAGWGCEAPSAGGATRHDAAGDVTALVAGVEQRWVGGRAIYGWSGGLVLPGTGMILWCKLRSVWADGVHAIRAIERAEAGGPLSAAWEGQEGAPEFPRWMHVVRRGRDVWARVEPDGRIFTVRQSPPAGLHGPFAYTVWVNTDIVHWPSSRHVATSSDPAVLIEEVERQFELDSGLAAAPPLALVRRR